jgi:hypothetical protein
MSTAPNHRLLAAKPLEDRGHPLSTKPTLQILTRRTFAMTSFSFGKLNREQRPSSQRWRESTSTLLPPHLPSVFGWMPPGLCLDRKELCCGRSARPHKRHDARR